VSNVSAKGATSSASDPLQVAEINRLVSATSVSAHDAKLDDEVRRIIIQEEEKSSI